MNICGIIAEYNPMHNGHIYHIQKTKELTKADYTILILSGEFTQAGNISCINKFNKASIALKYGIDLVIQLPIIYSTSSSEYFCKASVNILNSLGCNSICFGAECKNIDTLYSISKKLINNEKDIWKDIKNTNLKGNFPSIRSEILKNYLTSEEIQEIDKSNNILGIEYIKNIILLGDKIKPYIIERIDGISSSKIRKNKLDNLDYLKENTPKEISNYLIKNNFILNDKIYKILRYNIINLGKDNLKHINEVTEGLENRIYDAAIKSLNYKDFINNIKSKRYIESKIKRICINILLNITKDLFKNSIDNSLYYARILKIKEDKKELLSYISKNSNMPIITKISENIHDNELLQLDMKANNIYNIITKNNLNQDYINKIIF